MFGVGMRPPTGKPPCSPAVGLIGPPGASRERGAVPCVRAAYGRSTPAAPVSPHAAPHMPLGGRPISRSGSTPTRRWLSVPAPNARCKGGEARCQEGMVPDSVAGYTGWTTRSPRPGARPLRGAAPAASDLLTGRLGTHSPWNRTDSGCSLGTPSPASRPRPRLQSLQPPKRGHCARQHPDPVGLRPATLGVGGAATDFPQRFQHR